MLTRRRADGGCTRRYAADGATLAAVSDTLDLVCDAYTAGTMTDTELVLCTHRQSAVDRVNHRLPPSNPRLAPIYEAIVAARARLFGEFGVRMRAERVTTDFLFAIAPDARELRGDPEATARSMASKPKPGRQSNRRNRKRDKRGS